MTLRDLIIPLHVEPGRHPGGGHPEGGLVVGVAGAPVGGLLRRGEGGQAAVGHGEGGPVRVGGEGVPGEDRGVPREVVQCLGGRACNGGVSNQ